MAVSSVDVLVKVQSSPLQEYVKDAVGGWLTGSPPPPPLPATRTGLNSDMSLTSSRGSLMPSPESSVQSKLPAFLTWL
jgi:hypothetical protein